MGVKNVKQKGNSFERELSQIFSLWWTNKKSKTVFMRSASSGAWNTIHRKDGATAHSGDIEASDEVGKPFTNKVMVEAKWYKAEESLLFEVLVSKKQQVLGWWSKCEKEATDVLKTPILVVKFNHKVPFIVIPNYFYSEVYKEYGSPSIKSSLIIQLDFDDTIYKHLVVMRFDDFLKWCKPEFFKKGGK
jgi:hypothetical protein